MRLISMNSRAGLTWTAVESYSLSEIVAAGAELRRITRPGTVGIEAEASFTRRARLPS